VKNENKLSRSWKKSSYIIQLELVVFLLEMPLAFISFHSVISTEENFYLFSLKLEKTTRKSVNEKY
jgi:hypothetical protein